MSKTIGLSEVPTSRAIGASDNEVVDGGGSITDKTIENLSKFRK